VTTKEQIKNTGATFTPSMLADYLSGSIAKYLTNGSKKILDPACGEGELLVSISRRLQEMKGDFEIVGYDSNAEYLDIAQDRVRLCTTGKTSFVHQDFLEAVELTQGLLPLNFYGDAQPKLNQLFDVVIANPPYVRTQLIGAEQAQILSRKFKLTGRVDLYYPFLISMTECLKDGGILGVITSNRYLSTKAGEGVRKFLTENFEILELIDLGDTKLFDAAVLPAIFIGRKLKLGKIVSPKFTKIYEDLNGYQGEIMIASDIYEVLKSSFSGYYGVEDKVYKKTSGVLGYKIGSTRSWDMLAMDESEWVSRINSAAKNYVRDFFNVKVGIKSTADKVFISSNWDEMGSDIPEEQLLKELISQENISPWIIKDDFKLKVLYPHVFENGSKGVVDLNLYPRAKKYLLLNEEKLKSRDYLISAGRNWFELWVSHRPDHWSYPKLIFPDISFSPRFCFDRGGRVVNGNCYWIFAQTEDDVDKLLLIQGISNSKLMTKYHDLVFNNKLYSGRRRYFSQYVEKYPLPDFQSTSAKEIICIVKKLNSTVDRVEIVELEELLEIKVAEAFNVEPILDLF
jgi:adenine-specific DNA-methyltransferase